MDGEQKVKEEAVQQYIKEHIQTLENALAQSGAER